MAVANSTGGSSRVRVYRFGYSDYGRPMIIGVVTSPANWAKMETNKAALNALSDPEHTSPSQAEALIQTTIPVVWFEATQHSDEPGSAEAAMEMLYLMSASTDPAVMNVLNNVIFIINPAQNPDGHDMWVAWHYQWSNMGNLTCSTQPYCAFGPGSEVYYATEPAYWSKYVSHDNNRDWFKANLIENQNNEFNAFEVWHPQIFEDHHEDDGFGRLYTPPNPDNVNPNVSPVIRAGWNELGEHIAAGAVTAGLPGFNEGYAYDMWFPGYGDTWPSFHNAIGMTFEIATSWYNLPPGAPGDDTVPFAWEQSGVRWNYIYPWCAASFMGQPSGVGSGVGLGNGSPGNGCSWTLEDNNNYQESATWSDLEFAASLGKELLWSYYMAGYQNVEYGETYPPYAFVIPPTTPDPGRAAKMLNTLIRQDVEVDEVNATFTVSNACSINQNTCGSQSFLAGSYVVRMNQPLRGYAKTLLELQDYPTNVEDENGVALGNGVTSDEPMNGGVSLPYDITGWTEPLVMGVQTYNVTDPSVLKVPMYLVSGVEPPAGGIVASLTGENDYGYAFNHNMNNALTVMNRLLEDGITLYEAQSGFTQQSPSLSFEPGTLIVPMAAGLTTQIDAIGKEFNVPIYPLAVKPTVRVYKVTQPKIGVLYDYAGTGIYSSSNNSTMDEGWTRWVLDHGPQNNINMTENEFTYTRLSPLSIDTGYVNGTGAPIGSFNIIIIPPGVGASANSTSNGNLSPNPPGYQTSCTNITNHAPDLGVPPGYTFHGTYTCPNYDPGVPVPQGGNPTPVYGEQLSIDSYGVANLVNFVKNGGTVLCEDSSTSFCTSDLGGITTYPSSGHAAVFAALPGVTRADTSSIYAPGTVVKLSGLNATSPWTYGYSTGSTAAFWESSSAMTITGPSRELATYASPTTYLSGYLYDPNNILPGKAAAAVVPVGKGFVVLLGFRALERAEADATFMMYFDAIYYSSAVNTNLP
jgi:hypothetical protein